MTTLLGEQSYPAEGEMVGIGARRKNMCRQTPCVNGQNHRRKSKKQSFSPHHSEISQMISPEKINHIPLWNTTRREKKHVYDEITLTRDEEGTHFRITDKTDSHSPKNHKNMLETCQPTPDHCNKPKLPPKPSKYVLRDKRLRHVYHTIELPHERQPEPPPLPNKPVHLQRLKDDSDIPPPVPPRVPNKEAIKQRHKLDKEYFENLRKSVDENLLDLAEEGDLPVPIIRDSPLPQEEEIWQNYPLDPSIPGRMGSPESDIALGGSVTASPDPARRHSLPPRDANAVLHHGALLSENLGFTPPPDLPARALSLEAEIENTCPVLAGMNTEGKFKASESPYALLARNLQLLKICGWYWGNMTWQEAEALLGKKGEGAFLMRDSQNPLHLLTVTVRSSNNTIHHIRVEFSEGKFQLYEPGRTVSRSAEQCVRHSNIEQFIKLAMKHSISGSFLYFVKPKNMGEPPIQIRLLMPVSRFSKVKSLQYCCRMVIRNCLVADYVSNLTVPTKIKEYLLRGPYYDPDEEC